MAQLISKQDFIDGIFDFENEKEWKFKGEKPCIIDFYADWCGPCRMLSPIIEELSGEYGDKVDFFKVNTEQEPELAGAFGVQSIPTLIFVPMEGKPMSQAGLLPKETLEEIINKELVK